jgi:hypothetical protein
MQCRAVLLTLAVISAACLAGCKSEPGISEPEPEVAPPKYAFTLVSPRTLPSTDAFGIIADTIVVELRDRAGKLRTGKTFAFVSVDGWVRSVGESSWFRSGLVDSDSSGRFRLIWQLAAAPTQHLRLTSSGPDSLTLTATLPRTAPLLVADTVVASGPFAVCVQQGGRIGCVGTGRCTKCGESTSISHSPGHLHWFRLPSPVASISSNTSGACALLLDGNTSCWNGLGPDSVARSDIGHPPFVEVRGAVGRTAAGAVWTKPSGAPRDSVWLKIRSDSIIVKLLDQYDERTACGLTLSKTVLCANIRTFPGIPSFSAAAMLPMRDSTDGSIVRATGGYSTIDLGETSYGRVVVRRSDGQTVMFVRSAFDSTAWNAPGRIERIAVESDPGTRACIPLFGTPCDQANPWLSVSEAGRLSRSHISYTSGHYRLCGVRDVVLCYTLDGTSQLMRTLNSSIRLTPSLDTIRLAP